MCCGSRSLNKFWKGAFGFGGNFSLCEKTHFFLLMIPMKTQNTQKKDRVFFRYNFEF